MLIYKGTEYRNLEEQVRQNKEDIARHYEIDRALANLGIEVVGQVYTPSELPDPLTYQGAFGDTYAVGDPAAVSAGIGYYTYFVFTRPDENAGNRENHWLNVGRISIVGPQGVPGPQGPKGERGESTRWYAAVTPPGNPSEDDLFLDTTDGNVYRYYNNKWNLVANIRGPKGSEGMPGREGPQGPQGERGPKGERGDVGGFINIVGILASASLLPLPSSVRNLTYAYLVGAAAPYDLYVQVGEDIASSVWTNTGTFNAATAVTVNGNYQNIWDADTKLDKVTGLSKFNQAYVKTTSGDQRTFPVTSDVYNNAIVRRTEDGDVLVPNTTVSPYGAVNKGFVENNEYVTTRLTFHEPNLQGVVIASCYFNVKKSVFDSVKAYEYFISKDITSFEKALPCTCVETKGLAFVYYDANNDTFKIGDVRGQEDDKYDVLEWIIL